jgi:hypothetical protein
MFWKKITTFFITKKFYGFMDHNLYYMHEDGKVVILVIYVDDLSLIGNHTKRIEWLIKQLTNRFKMSQLGGMELYFQVKFFYFLLGIFKT